MDKHFLSYEQFRSLARPTSTHLERDIVESYISECEDVYIVPSIGTTLFYKLAEYDAETPDTYLDTLLDGGVFSYDGCGCYSQSERMCYGIRKALAYFVYGKMMLDDGLTVTRSGNIQHLDEYGQRMEQRVKVNRYNDVLASAQLYLNSVLEYIKQNDSNQPVIQQFGTRIKAIGD